jgi:hypothetical protein
MTYYNFRKEQSIRTLNDFKKYKKSGYSFEVVFVDDNSSLENNLKDFISTLDYPIKYIYISKEEKGTRVNPGVAYNKGFENASGKIIIIQNPECYHVGDLLRYVQDNLKEEDYFSFSCYYPNNEELDQELMESEDKIEKISDSDFENRNKNISKYKTIWYNHPIYRPKGYHFCSAIYKSKLDVIGGFNQDFSDGYCFEDNELVYQIKKNFKMKLKIVEPKEGFVIHQYHYKGEIEQIDKLNDNHPLRQGYLRNKKIFDEIKEGKICEENNLALISESSYPGGGGEEFLYDLAIFFTSKKIKVYWFTFHDWGKCMHLKTKTKKEYDYFTQIDIPNCEIVSPNAFNLLKEEFKTYKINYILHQGRGHKLVTDLGNDLNIPTITFWCFWEEALNINWDKGLKNIKNNLDYHPVNSEFEYIINNIDFYYFASTFVKEIIEEKYKISLPNTHIFPTLSNNNRFKKNEKIDSYNSLYITLLDAHTLKGGKLFSELVELNPALNFLAIRTEDEDTGPNAIISSYNKVKNPLNKFFKERVNDVKEIYNKTKILLCPTYLDETFCRVVFEAFFNKIPVIFSNAGNLGNLEKIESKLLIVKDYDVLKYNEFINKLVTDKIFYNNIIQLQLKVLEKFKNISNPIIIYEKLKEIENKKNKNIGIFTPWCDQGLGIQSRIYKKLFEDEGYKVFIFSTQSYVSTEYNDLIASNDEWLTDNIYNSPNKRLDINFLELDLFVKNYKIKNFIISEIQYEKIFEIGKYLKDKYNIKVHAIPNVECIRKEEVNKFQIFFQTLTNNEMTFKLLDQLKIPNLINFGFKYDIPSVLKVDKIDHLKKVKDKIKILHLTGLNGLFRKRTLDIIEIFDNLYKQGLRNFELNVVIQGNFNQDIRDKISKPFLNIIQKHLTYSDILNLYNQNHLSIQISKHEGLGLGFYESCFMNTPVITLDAPPHNEIIHHQKNGWLLPCYLKRDEKPENPFSIIEQTQINKFEVETKIKEILSDIQGINQVINTTKVYFEQNINKFKNLFKHIFKV